MKPFNYIFFLLTTLLFACSQNETIVLVENQKSNYQIVIKEDAGELEKKAAHQLQEYIKKSTQAVLPIATMANAAKNSIIIETDSSDINNSGYIQFKTKEGNVYINGSDPKHTLYAVYEFIEQYLSCRFYAPGVEIIPEKTIIEIPHELNHTYSPPINTRTVHSNLFYENHDFADKHKVTYKAFPNYVEKARVHTFHRFVPAEIYFNKHPEYYALSNGERRSTQLCLSNPEVFEIIKQKVSEYFIEQPEAKVISVSQDDNTQYCRCDKCAAIDKEEGSPSGSMIRFVNKIAKNFPEKTISTLAYQYTRKACKTIPDDNVLITLCSIECDRSAPIEEKCKDFAEDLKAWKLLTSNIRIWDYTTQFTNFLAPFPNLHTLQPNIRFFVDNNATWVFEQHSRNPSELFELRSYLMAKLLWKPHSNTDSLITDFTDGYYEEAGSKIKEYIDLIHKELKKDKDFFLFLYGGPSQAFNSFLSAENLMKYNAIFDDAEKLIVDKPEVLKRIKTARLSTRYATMEACRANLSQKYSLKNQSFVKNEYEEFKSTCRNVGIEWMNETSFSVKEYLELYKINLERANRTNLAAKKPVNLLTKPKKYAREDPLTLTDGALGGGSFYANWLGFEGNDMVAVVDLSEITEINSISTTFLQVINHIVFLPIEVSYSYSENGKNYTKLGTVKNPKPLKKNSKVNDTYDFTFKTNKQKTRYIKIEAKNMKKAPEWHHGSGLPSWIFADEIIIN